MDGAGAVGRAEQHVARFNHAVRAQDWTGFVELFDPSAAMDFPDLPIGPFVGRAAILAAYRADPPADTMRVLDAREEDGADVVAFGWSGGGTGRMVLRRRAGLVESLRITFDPPPLA